MSSMNDLAILGGGPAGVAAGVYASRKQLKTVFITKDFQSQSAVSDGIENWIGDIKITGQELAKKFEDHLRAYAEDIVQIQTGEMVEKVSPISGGFEIKTDKETYQAKTVLVATGSHRRKLPAENADKFEHKGITYCATCDGPVFAGQDVVVVGGGNAAFETAAQLLAYTKSVTLLNRSNNYRADPITIEAVLKDEKMTAIKKAEIVRVNGDKFVTGITYKDLDSGEEKEIKTGGIFVEIGSVPTTEYVSDLVDLDDYKRIKIDPWTQRASLEGIWAAGDCTNILYHQNNIAAGDAVKALEDIFIHLKKQG
jgi:NADH-dependent peroxiredoxin subunit F